MKVQVGYDYLNAPLQCLSVHEGIEPDQHDAGLLAQAVANALLIFDWGCLVSLHLCHCALYHN